jgi:CBS domain-containing protein
MTIAGILKDKGGAVVTVDPDAPLKEAVRLLVDHRIGAVLVVGPGAIEGVVSERDVVRAIHQHGQAALDEPVARMMSSPVITVTPCDPVEHALETMTERRFRHLPVIEDGRLVGIVSIGDLVKRRIDEATREAALLKDYIAAG